MEPAILVVEDDRLLRRLAIDTLCADGLPAIGVDGAAEGLELLAANPAIKLLITDINMPGMNGLEMLSIVQAKHPAVKLMAISGRAHLAIDHLPPAAEFVSKPFTARQFLMRVHCLLDG